MAFYLCLGDWDCSASGVDECDRAGVDFLESASLRGWERVASGSINAASQCAVSPLVHLHDGRPGFRPMALTRACMQQPAPKGPNEIAQGEALGKRHPPDVRPERAAWRARISDPPRLPIEPLHISPFQGSSDAWCRDPGLRPGLSHVALSGPRADIVSSPA